MQQYPLLQTKLYIPPIWPELVSRPRLIERLNAGLNRKLTLISAPAGFGKTTLVSEWATGCEQLEPKVRTGGMHLVIATREDPLLPLARLRARGQLTELRATDQTRRIWFLQKSSLNLARSCLSSTDVTRSLRSPKLSGTMDKDTPEEKSSLRCEWL